MECQRNLAMKSEFEISTAEIIELLGSSLYCNRCSLNDMTDRDIIQTIAALGLARLNDDKLLELLLKESRRRLCEVW